ncbi:MAG: PadR family transcriptional regulator, partial [Halobaculum sp.]
MNSKLLPLGLLAAADEETIEGITRFQKLVFLAQREQSVESLYDFEAADYGPFSKELYDDLDKLVAKDFLSRKKEQTQLRN